MGAKSGVCWLGPASPSVSHGGSLHFTKVSVLFRLEVSTFGVLKGAALFLASPWMAMFVGSTVAFFSGKGQIGREKEADNHRQGDRFVERSFS